LVTNPQARWLGVQASLISTQHLAPPDRFGYWLDVVHSEILELTVSTDHVHDFEARMKVVEFGGLQITHHTYPPLDVRRTDRQIRRSDPECYYLAIALRGDVQISQGRHTVDLDRNDMTLYDSRRPFVNRVRSGQHRLGEGVLVVIPRALMPISMPPREVDQMLGVRIPAEDGMARVTRRFLIQLLQDVDRGVGAGVDGFTAADETHLASATMSLLAAILAHQMDRWHALPRETQRQARMAQVLAYINQHLDEPGLGPPAIAAACNMSVRELNRLFHDHHEHTVANWVRAQRLEQCARALEAEPGRPMASIAARFGWDAAHFTRIFKRYHDKTPTDYRKEVLKRRQG
jgi:AraC-like DNA-binding protein